MRRLIILILIAFVSLHIMAQTEVNDSIVPLHRKYEKAFDELQRISNAQPTLNAPEVYPITFNKTEMEAVELLKIDVTSFSSMPTTTMGPVSSTSLGYNQLSNSAFSFVSDYNSSEQYRLLNGLSLSGYTSKQTYPTLGSMYISNPQLNYYPAEWINLSGGVYGAKYNMMGHSFNDIGYNGAIKLIPHDRIRFNIYGQYSVYGNKNGIAGPLSQMYPQTYYGGSIEFKITEKFGVEGGVIRELNPMSGKWENRRFIVPVFY